MNTQPVEKIITDTEQALQVHSVFYTIQGEGPYTGRPAIFIRLAGCNLQCPQCDTDYTSKRQYLYPLQILKQVNALCPGFYPLIVITGGEPLRQNIGPLIQLLHVYDYKTIQIETNGTVYRELPYQFVTIVCSPKTGSVNPKLIPHIAAWKYVLDYRSIDVDGLPLEALNHPCKPYLARPPTYTEPFKIYVNPVDTGEEETNTLNLLVTKKSAKAFGYTFGIQLHKLIDEE